MSDNSSMKFRLILVAINKYISYIINFIIVGTVLGFVGWYLLNITDFIKAPVKKKPKGQVGVLADYRMV